MRAPDAHAARELELYIENDEPLYRQQQAIVLSLARKFVANKYDHALAPKLWYYLADAGAKKYVKEFGGGKYGDVFSVATRRAVAQKLADDYKSDVAEKAVELLNAKKGKRK